MLLAVRQLYGTENSLVKCWLLGDDDNNISNVGDLLDIASGSNCFSSVSIVIVL